MTEQHDELVASLEADLRALSAAEADLERDAEVAERTRAERTAITLRDRLRGAHGPVEISTYGGGTHAGLVVETGAGWVLLEHVPVGQRQPTAEHLVMLDAVLTVRGLGRIALGGRGVLADRSTGSVLRAWCRDRSQVSALLIDGSVVPGMASATFLDHLELSTGGGGTLAVPLAALAVLSR